MKYILASFLILLSFSSLFAQEEWDLSRCIKYAQENSLQVEQSNISLQNTALNKLQAEKSRYPNASASINPSVNSGRSIDLSSYQFVQKVNFFTSFSLGANMLLYNGGRINNTIKQENINIQAAQEDLKQINNNLALSISNAYLSILLAEETLKAAEEQKKQIETQLAQTQKLINAGSLAAMNAFDMEAQLAKQDLAIVNSQNAKDMSYLNLKQLMNYDFTKDLKIVVPELVVPENPTFLTLDALYNKALGNQPNIKAGELQEESAKIGVDIAKSALKPSLSAFANLGTNYSGNGQHSVGTETYTVYQTVNIPQIGDIVIPFEQKIAINERNPFFNQVKENFNQQVGLSLSVPIYSQQRSKIGIQRAELAVKNASLMTEQKKVQLKNDIANALASAKAAQKRYQAATKSLAATNKTLEAIQKKFTAGSANTFETTTAQNNLTLITNELLQAKYEYLFRIKILEFYEGNLF
jgi:outer membrane protein